MAISIRCPISWVLNKWQTLPLGQQLDGELAASYRVLLGRLHDQFPSTGYATVTQGISLVTNVGASLVATYFISPPNAPILYGVYAVSLLVSTHGSNSAHRSQIPTATSAHCPH